jgi:hypothetical protein
MEVKPDFLNKHLQLGDWTLYNHQHLNVEGAHQLQSAVITHTMKAELMYTNQCILTNNAIFRDYEM